VIIGRAGIFSDVPLAAYLADPAPIPSLSAGCAQTLISRSPLHAWIEHPRLNPAYEREEDTKFDIGTAAHEALLQGLDRCEVIQADDWRTKAAKEARDAARAAGKIPLLTKHYEPLAVMVEAAKAFIETTELAGLFDDGEAEATVLWDEGATWFRARPDWLSADRRLIVHYKTCTCAQPDAFIRGPLTALGYDTTLAFYERGLAAVTGGDPRSVILAQETKPPHSCTLIGLSPAFASIASGKVARAVQLWERCMKSGRWPSYPSQIHYAEPKPWQLAEEEERDTRFTESVLEGGIPL
jgi:hypothetical protein